MRMQPATEQAAELLTMGEAIALLRLKGSRLLRIQDAARYLSATTWFVETLIREKRIPSLILGKRRVIDVKDLDAWIEKQKAHASAEAAA